MVQRRVDDLLHRFPRPADVPTSEFLAAQFDLGLAWVEFGVGFGGLDVAGQLQQLVDDRLLAAGAPASTGDYMGLHQAAHCIHEFGSAEQKKRFLRPIFLGEEGWCQLFSEPGAGSDLAGLATMAVRDGDEWIVTGQKVWTSEALDASWAILVARSDPDVPKHRGLTFFLCDMKSPGIEVRPLRQADGNSSFSEVFLTEVRVADSLRLGDVGQGWAVSIAALHSERGGTGAIFARPMTLLMEHWRTHADPAQIGYQARRDQMMRSWVEHRVLELLGQRVGDGSALGGAAQAGSLVKIASSEATQRLSNIMLSVMGPGGQIGFDYEAYSEAGSSFGGIPSDQMLAVRSRAMTIEGGTNEIQRKIVAEQLLGLPRDEIGGKTIAWRDVPRN
jgi:alkylation response protein AidB-like acyl-CoA dehydrogenase